MQHKQWDTFTIFKLILYVVTKKICLLHKTNIPHIFSRKVLVCFAKYGKTTYLCTEK